MTEDVEMNMLTNCSPVCLLISFLIVLSGCGIAPEKVSVNQYNDFGVRSAESKLWNEAIFRWNQVLKIDPRNAKVHNNLGVAFEALGRIDDALESYKRATELDSNSKYYRFNYRKCRLQMERNKRDSGAESDGKEEPTE